MCYADFEARGDHRAHLIFTFTFSHFADSFIQSDLQLGNT